MITLDIRKLTAAEVDLIEDTLNDQLSARLGGQIVTFNDVMAEASRAAAVRDGEDVAVPPGTVRIPMGKLVRTFELVDMRRTNPAATWADTGQTALFDAIQVELPPPAPDAVPDPDAPEE